MKGIGIDTGGTCTDAVVYDFESKEVLASAKTLTTHHDLKIGIAKVLRQLPEELLRECSQAALSTTLATNACVENEGGRGKIIFIGISRKVFQETWRSYGFRSLEDIMLVDCRISMDPAASEAPDWEAFRREIPAFLADCDCVSIVQLYSADYGGAYERKAAEVIRSFPAFAEMPVILGNTLFADRNAIRRGAGALLNARLVPVIYAFMQAIREVFSSMHLEIPMTIIRSDGSQMSEQFAMERPVETLLCGPAASVIGACALSDTPDALVIDMGGTTTDIAIVKKNIVRRAEEGIQVGDWKTFVKGLYVDTFGLGGDTRLSYDRGGKIYLGKTRVQPLCTLAAQYPQVLEELRTLGESDRLNIAPLHEYFILLRDPGKIGAEAPVSGAAGAGVPAPVTAGKASPSAAFYSSELALCRALRKGPLSYEKAAAAMGKDVYAADFSRLESARVILRCGLTPTDFMHIRGDYDAYCGEASRLAARFFVRSSGAESVEDLADRCYDLVTERLYKNIIRVLLQTGREALAKDRFDSQMTELIDYAWQLACTDPRRRDRFLPDIFRTRAKLVGVGAPTHVFLPRVAGMLHTQAVLPPHAAVANAVGAITARVTAMTRVEVTPLTGESGGTGYGATAVTTEEGRRTFRSRAAAVAFAKKEGRRIASEKAIARGAKGELSLSQEHEHKEAPIGYGTIWLYDVYRFFASGSSLR